MESFEKGLFPSKATKILKFASTGMEENNENDWSQDDMNPKYCKKTVAKHFMSPTISAASKAAAPRKKILGERKENSRNFHPQNHKSADWNKSTRNHSDAFSSRTVDPEDDVDSNAYDPRKNFLSPRPKYLRFNPNRRREIFKRLEREELNCSFESEDVSESSTDENNDSSFLPPEESVTETKIQEDIVVDDDEEEEEEREWCLGEVLKFLLTLIACVLSTSYICSMNSSPSERTVLDVGDGCMMFKNQTIEFYPVRMQENGLFEMRVGDNYEVQDGGFEKSFEEKIVEDGAEKFERREKDSVSKDGPDTTVGFEGEIALGFEFGVDNLEQSTATIGDESVYLIGPVIRNEENVSKIEVAETEITASDAVDAVDFETHDFVESIASRTEEIEDVGDFVMEKEIEGSNQLQEIKLSGEPEETQNESNMVDELTDSVNNVGEIEHDVEVETQKTTRDSPVVIGVIVVSIISALLALFYYSKKGGSTPAEEPTRKQHKFVAKEKATEILPPIERKVEFFARRGLSSSYPPMEEEANRRIHAPSVELIGELVVGNVSRRFNSSEKYEMTESEEINATVEHSTTSSPSQGSFTTERKRRSKREGQEMVGVTPIRRSSRLRSRAAVTSP